ncbi:unannotated protein [freshwater metagenome]|uniref:Unannotated protein n=1 Tax=freshwater metagenome TaxID=449393 RepID=A0A6J7DFP5_9ZZZZ
MLRAAAGRALPPGLAATVELHVQNGAGDAVHTLSARNGHLEYCEAPALDPDARVSGDPQDYVAALGPAPSSRGLRIEGDRQAAGAMLGLLTTAA